MLHRENALLKVEEYLKRRTFHISLHFCRSIQPHCIATYMNGEFAVPKIDVQKMLHARISCLFVDLHAVGKTSHNETKSI